MSQKSPFLNLQSFWGRLCRLNLVSQNRRIWGELFRNQVEGTWPSSKRLNIQKGTFFRPPCIWFSKWAAEAHRCQLLGKHMCQSYIWSSWTKRLVRLHTWWSHNLAPRYKDNSQCPKNTQLATNQIFAHAQKDDRSPPVLSLRWWSVQLSIWKPWLLWGANKATVTARNHSGATEHVLGTSRQMLWSIII